jgi:hypothetical protein
MVYTHTGMKRRTGEKKKKEGKEERKDIRKSESLEIPVDDQIIPLYWPLDRERKKRRKFLLHLALSRLFGVTH